MPEPGWETIEVEESTLKEMLLHGGARMGEDGIAELTPEFTAWFHEWIARKIAEVI